MEGYAFKFNGRTFTPDGDRTNVITDTETHNKALEAAELEFWQTKPERFAVYVSHDGVPGHEPCNLPGCNKVHRGERVTTWLGTQLGAITRASTYRNNLGARITCITFKGTNGATYHGRYGADWSQLCRVRRSK